MVKISIAACALLTVGFGTSAAVAEGPIPISECAFSQSYGGTVSYEGHRDIGNGFVTYLERNVELDENYDGGRFIIAGCKSGSTLAIDYEEEQLSEVQNFVLTATASREKVTLSTFKDRFSSLGMWTALNKQSLEHCPCAAFYPEAKGNKGPWQQRYEHP
jgi:hypothetical protein